MTSGHYGKDTGLEQGAIADRRFNTYNRDHICILCVVYNAICAGMDFASRRNMRIQPDFSLGRAFVSSIGGGDSAESDH